MVAAGTSVGQFIFAVLLPCGLLGARYLVSDSGPGIAHLAFLSPIRLSAEDSPRNYFFVHGGTAGGICDVLCERLSEN